MVERESFHRLETGVLRQGGEHKVQPLCHTWRSVLILVKHQLSSNLLMQINSATGRFK